MSVPMNTIEKTMMTGFLFGTFWDRWVASGLQKPTLSELRYRLYKLEDWIRILKLHADSYHMQAESQHQSLHAEAENTYRLAGLHYTIIQWLFPETGEDKRRWYESCKEMHRLADSLAADEIINVVIQVDGNDCYGRVRCPLSPKGCVIIVNPIDSSKEESVVYEEHFSRMGFVTMSFDGPGQGETYAFAGHQASLPRWDCFMEQLIEFASAEYPELSLTLFGTGSGGAWSIRGSSHPKISRTVAVSPVFESSLPVPDYMKERLSYISLDGVSSLSPKLESVEPRGLTLVVHGNKDEIVKSETIHEIYNRLPEGKRLVLYEEEGHCCSYRTEEIIKSAADWFLK